MSYDIFICVLGALGITGALVFSFKIFRNPVCQIGIGRKTPRTVVFKPNAFDDFAVARDFGEHYDPEKKRRELVDTKNVILRDYLVTKADLTEIVRRTGVTASWQIRYSDRRFGDFGNYDKVSHSLGSTLGQDIADYPERLELQD